MRLCDQGLTRLLSERVTSRLGTLLIFQRGEFMAAALQYNLHQTVESNTLSPTLEAIMDPNKSTREDFTTGLAEVPLPDSASQERTESAATFSLDWKQR